MRVEATSSRCISSGNCVLACPEVFDQDDDAMVILLRSEVSPELEVAVVEAVEACPSAAINFAE